MKYVFVILACGLLPSLASSNESVAPTAAAITPAPTEDSKSLSEKSLGSGHLLHTVHTDTIVSSESCTVVIDSMKKVIGKVCRDPKYFLRADVYPGLTIGVGISAITINAKTGGIGFLSSIDPLTLTYNGLQYVWIRSSEIHKFALWETSVGLSISKPDSGSFTLGVTLMPWGVRIDQFVFGIGAKWMSTQNIDFQRKNWSLVFPVTYSI